jgi:hypothetical protein
MKTVPARRLIFALRLVLTAAVGLGLLGGGIALATASPAHALDLRDELI